MLKDTFESSRDILNQNLNHFKLSLDVDSLFTNISLDETINITIVKLFSENETIHNLNKDQFKCLLTLAIKESYFLFNCSLECKPSYYKRYVDNIFVLCKLEI